MVIGKPGHPWRKTRALLSGEKRDGRWLQLNLAGHGHEGVDWMGCLQKTEAGQRHKTKRDIWAHIQKNLITTRTSKGGQDCFDW